MQRRALLSIAIGLVAGGPLAAQDDRPPGARRGEQVDVYHGVRVPDPYRWMERLDATETVDWVRAQDEWTRSFVSEVPGRDGLRRTIAGAAMALRVGTPTEAAGRYVYSTFRTTGGALRVEAVWMRHGVDGAPQRLLDGDSLAQENRRIVLVSPSPDGRWLAFGVAPAGSRWMELHVRSIEPEDRDSDVLTGLRRGQSPVLWRADGSGFYYGEFDRSTVGDARTAAVGAARIRFHRVGASQNDDVSLFRPPAGAGWSIGAALTADDRYLVVTAKEPASPGNRVYVIDLERDDSLTLLVPGFTETFSFVGSQGDWFWFQTDADAPKGRVVAISGRQPERMHWKELIGERDEAITNWLGVSAIGGHLLVGYLDDARHTVRVFTTAGEFRYELELPREGGSLWSGFRGSQDEPEAFYSLSGVADPGTVYRLDVRTGRSTVFASADVAYDPDRYVTQQVFYPAADGTRIPMFLVRRRDLSSDGPAPVYMYGYAADWAAAPWFQPQIVAWMDLGGIWALPNTRGGTEYGEVWNAAGSRLRKQTAIDDYLAAAEWLIERGYTTPRLMVANASSAGGPVGGAALVQRPDLFGAAVLDYPVLDMLRYDRFTTARSWTHEYGTADDPDEFRALLGYSPYHGIRDGVCYPPTLVAPGELDELAPPLHAYKFVAALQHAQACDAPIALRVAWGAGHASGATAGDAIEMWVDQLSFLIRALDLTPPEVSAP